MNQFGPIFLWESKWTYSHNSNDLGLVGQPTRNLRNKAVEMDSQEWTHTNKASLTQLRAAVWSVLKQVKQKVCKQVKRIRTKNLTIARIKTFDDN